MAKAPPQPDPYSRVVHRFATAGKLSAVQSMLNWDAQTHMPRGGAWARGMWVWASQFSIDCTADSLPAVAKRWTTRE